MSQVALMKQFDAFIQPPICYPCWTPHNASYVLTSTRISAFLESSGGVIVPINLRNRLPCTHKIIEANCQMI